MHKGNVAVVGIGNLLLTDDGAGIHAISKMKDMEEFEGIDLIDGGTYIFDLLEVFTGYEKIIVIDSVKGGYQPGTIYRLTPGDLAETVMEDLSLHNVQILHLLQWVKYMGHHPQVVIIGIEPTDMGFSTELTPAVEKALPVLFDAVKNELGEVFMPGKEPAGTGENFNENAPGWR